MKYIIILLLFSSCSAGYHLKQSKRHLKIAEQKGAIITRDTVFITKEVIVPEVKFDTVIRNVNFSDTLIITQDKIVTKVKINTVTKEVYINTICPPDTIKIKVPFTVHDSISADCWPKWWLVIALLAGLGLAVVVNSLRK